MTGAPMVRSIVGGIPVDLLAVADSSSSLWRRASSPSANQWRHVRELGSDPQRPLLAATADEDGRAAGLDRAGAVERLVDAVVLALEARPFLREHELGDGQRLLEAVHPLLHRREVDPVADVLLLVPGGPDAEDGPAARQHVQRRDLLGEHRRIAVRDAGHERAQADRRGLAGQRGEDRPALEHRLGGRAHARDLVEVVHHGDELEAGRLGGLGLLDDAVEEALRRDVRVAVAGEVKTEPGVARGRRSRHAGIMRPSAGCRRRPRRSQASASGASMRSRSATVVCQLRIVIDL